MLIFIKLGGSLITDKNTEGSFREGIVTRLGQEIFAALKKNSDIGVLLGHGSGSFGHFAAAEHDTVRGVHSAEAWRAFAHVATVAAELNYLVASVFHQIGLPIMRMQLSASALSHDGQLVDMAVAPIRNALDCGLIPLIYGDVTFDDVRGGTIISTEKVFLHLARHFPVRSILLLGEVEGVLGPDGGVIPEINARNYLTLKKHFGASAGVDVTGGMETKVSDMLALTEVVPQLTIRIFNGKRDNLLREVLLGQANPGTLIRRS